MRQKSLKRYNENCNRSMDKVSKKTLYSVLMSLFRASRHKQGSKYVLSFSI